jgi:hypothetical protein
MTLDGVIEGLEYISSSPPQEHGGFHPQTIRIAKSALAFIRSLAQRAGESAPLPDCDLCGKHQTERGALMISEPQSNGMYFKTHVCVKCYEKIRSVTTRADTRTDRGGEGK